MTIQPHRRPEHSPSRHIPKGGQAPLSHAQAQDQAQVNDDLLAEPEVPGPSADLSRLRDETKGRALRVAVEAGHYNTIERRVCYILNHYPSNSYCDPELQQRYWM